MKTTDHLVEGLTGSQTHSGASLYELSSRVPVLVVFLRHFGCTFTRETLSDIAAARTALESRGVQPVIVHMADEQEARRFLERYGLRSIERISDPERRLYKAFDLRHGTPRQLLGPSVWIRGMQSCIIEGHGIGHLSGDVLQMPGVFLLRAGGIVRSFRHDTTADRPDYVALATP